MAYASEGILLRLPEPAEEDPLVIRTRSTLPNETMFPLNPSYRTSQRVNFNPNFRWESIARRPTLANMGNVNGTAAVQRTATVGPVVGLTDYIGPQLPRAPLFAENLMPLWLSSVAEQLQSMVIEEDSRMGAK